jgi:hypothetical protein
MLVVGALYLAGRLQLFPGSIDPYGIGVSFAIDSRFYRIEAANMATALGQHQFAQWWAFSAQPHVKLYSLSYAFLGPVLGYNLLSAEPLNLVFYLLVLMLVYWIGRELFEPRTGLIAAGIVAFWPSLLLHTTQMLRDPLFILSLLLLVFILIISLTRSLSLVPGLLAATAGVIACVLLWLIRGDMWELVFMIVAVGIVMSTVRQLWRRRLLLGNTVTVSFLMFAILSIPNLVPTYRQRDSMLRYTKEIQSSPTQPAPPLPSAVFGKAEPTSTTGMTKLAQRLGLLRHKFIINYPLAGSNIDTDIELMGIGDVVRYFPRALEIGLFAPFPNMWFKRGEQVGLVGRLLSGFETLCIYVLTLLALISIVLNRRRLSVWLVSSVIILGCSALGYVVVNVSTLYRMRYAFWILLVILAANALITLRARSRLRSESLTQANADLRKLPEAQIQLRLIRISGFASSVAALL